jgi:hypothetical protein
MATSSSECLRCGLLRGALNSMTWVRRHCSIQARQGLVSTLLCRPSLALQVITLGAAGASLDKLCHLIDVKV